MTKDFVFFDFQRGMPSWPTGIHLNTPMASAT